MDKSTLVWIGVLVSSVVTSIGESIPDESLPRRIAWIAGSALLYACLLDWNYSALRPIPLISLIVVWTVLNAFCTLALFIYFNQAALVLLRPSAYGVMALAVSLGVAAVLLANWVLSLLEEIKLRGLPSH